jgi:hypothetical protein
LRSGFRWKIFSCIEESAEDAAVGFSDFAFGRERAVGRIEGDLFDGLGFG